MDRPPVRPFVSFKWSLPLIGISEEGATDSRNDLAQCVRGWLDTAGISVDGPADRDGQLMELWAKRDRIEVEVLLGYVGDGPIEWLVNLFPRPGLKGFFFGRTKNSEQANELLKDCVRVLHENLSRSKEFTEVRWYNQSDFDRDHGATWHSDPE